MDDPFRPTECGWRTHEATPPSDWGPGHTAVIYWGGHSQVVSRDGPYCVLDGPDMVDALSVLVLGVPLLFSLVLAVLS